MQVGTSASRHLLPFFLFILSLSLDDFEEHLTIQSLGFLQSSVVVCKLLLAILVQPCKLFVESDLLGLLQGAVFKFCLLKSFLCTHLIKLCLTVLGTFLQLTKPLDLPFFLFLETDGFFDFSLFTLASLTLMLSNLGVQLPLSLNGGFLLVLLVLVCDLDLLVKDLDTLPLLISLLLVLSLDSLDVGKGGNLLLLSHLLVSIALLLTRSDLVNEDLSAALASLSCSLLTLKLFLDCLQPLDLHHHVKSLLLLDPVLLQHCVLLLLLVTNGVDLGGKHHLVHVLHIIVLLIHLILCLGQQLVLVIIAHLDLKRGSGGPLTVLPLHALLASDGHRHL